MVLILISTLIATVIINALIAWLFAIHHRREIARRERKIRLLATEIKNNSVYIAELQQRCRRRGLGLAGPNFIEYDVLRNGVAYRGRMFLN